MPDDGTSASDSTSEPHAGQAAYTSHTPRIHDKAVVGLSNSSVPRHAADRVGHHRPTVHLANALAPINPPSESIGSVGLSCDSTACRERSRRRL
jgi:hypothetical protein